MQTYPLGIAISRSGGRKAKADRHIRSARQRRKAFKAETEKVMQSYERKTGVSLDVSAEVFWEMAAEDPALKNLGRQLVLLRQKYLG